MSQWHFVIAAYSAALLPITALVLSSLLSMRRAEAEADMIGKR